MAPMSFVSVCLATDQSCTNALKQGSKPFPALCDYLAHMANHGLTQSGMRLHSMVSNLQQAAVTASDLQGTLE